MWNEQWQMSYIECKRQNACLKIMQTKIISNMLMRKAGSAHSKYKVDENLRLMLILNSLLSSKKHGCKVEDSKRRKCLHFPFLPPIQHLGKGWVFWWVYQAYKHCRKQYPSALALPQDPGDICSHQNVLPWHVSLRSRKPMGLWTDYSANFLQFDFFI